MPTDPVTAKTPVPPADDSTRRLLAWLAAGLLGGGVPSHEVEDEVAAVARALGHPDAQIGCLPTGVTVTLAPGSPATAERVDSGLRLDQLVDVSTLASGLRAGSMTVDQALARLGTLRSDPHRYRVAGLLVGGVLSGVGIALVLSPIWSSVLFAAIVAPLTMGLVLLSARSRTLRTLLPLVAGFGSAAAAFAGAQAGLVGAPLWTLVAPIAVILPGATIVTGLSELGAGAMVSGSSRLAHGIMQLLFFALGVAAAIAALRVPGALLDPTRPTGLGWWAPLLGVVIVTVSILLQEALPLRLLPWILVTILATFVAQTLGTTLLGGRWVGAFLGALVAALVAGLIEAIRPQVPRVVAFLPSFWLLVPGSVGLISVAQFETDMRGSLGAVVGVAVVVVALSIGVAVGGSLARPLHKRLAGQAVPL